MSNDATKSSFQTGTRKVPNTLGDRRTKTDAGRENLIQGRHVFRQWAAGDRTRHGGSVSWPTRRAPTPKPRGKDPVADLADTVPNTLEPLKRKCTILVATQMAVAVTLHCAKGTPTTASEGAMIRARWNRTVPATRRGSTTLGKRRLGRRLGNGTPGGS